MQTLELTHELMNAPGTQTNDWWAAGSALDFSEAVDIALDRIDELSSSLTDG